MPELIGERRVEEAVRKVCLTYKRTATRVQLPAVLDMATTNDGLGCAARHADGWCTTLPCARGKAHVIGETLPCLSKLAHLGYLVAMVSTLQRWDHS